MIFWGAIFSIALNLTKISMPRIRFLALLLWVLIVACNPTEGATSEVLPEQSEGLVSPVVETATPIPPQEPESTPTPPPAIEEIEPPPPTPSETSAPAVTDSWYPPGAILVITRGNDDLADVYAIGKDGGEQTVLTDVGHQVSVSPDGRWLGYVLWQDNGYSTLVLHDAASGERREMSPDTQSGMLRFLFDQSGSRLAYVDLGAYAGGRVPWSLIITNLDSGMSVRYDAVMADADARPLPGVPVGWSESGSKEHIILDTFLPYTEGGWMGVWDVPLPDGSVSGLLDTLSPRELVPSGAYSSLVLLAPDGQNVAYLGRDQNYLPDNYFPEYYDLAVNRLAVASLEEGSGYTLVEVDDGSALARAFAWSPSSDRLLYAQGMYEGESLAALVLKSTDLSGTVVTYGPLDVPGPGELMDLVWCDPAAVFFVTWDGQVGEEKLISFDLNTGASREIAAGRRVDIVTCVP